jgi:hypothetical protein
MASEHVRPRGSGAQAGCGARAGPDSAPPGPAPRSPGGAMSTTTDAQRADQIAYRVYTKLALVLADARAPPPPGPAKADKWVRMHRACAAGRR